MVCWMVMGLERGFADEADKAVMLFSSGFNCAEAVLTVLCQRMEKLGKSCGRAVPSVATGFGGGIGRSGGTCGALSGVVMAVGLMVGHRRADDLERKYMVYDLVSGMIGEFEREFGSSSCKDLIRADLRVEEERLRFRSQKVQDKACSKFVKWCVNQGSRLLDELREG
jgi:C_GCAxxG_C_C family probable redox protein